MGLTMQRNFLYMFWIFLLGCSTMKRNVIEPISTDEELAIFNKGKYYRSQAKADSNQVSNKKNLDSATICFEQLAGLQKFHLLNEERRYSILYLSDIYSNVNSNENDHSRLYSLYEAVGRLYKKDKILQDWLSERLLAKFKGQPFIDKHSWPLDSLLFTKSLHGRQKKLMKERFLLEAIYDSDQKYRRILYFDVEKLDSVRRKTLEDSVDIVDKQNYSTTEKILFERGWLSIKEVGRKANNAQFLVFQHIGDSATFVKHYSIIKKAYKRGDLDNEKYALYIDRYHGIKYRYQTYGTQSYTDKITGKIRPYPLKDSANVNKLRNKLGLDSIRLE